MKAATASKLLDQYRTAYDVERSIVNVPASIFNDRSLELIRAAKKVRADIRSAFGHRPDDVEAEAEFDKTLGLSLISARN